MKGSMKLLQVQGVLRVALAAPVVREKLSPELVASLSEMIDTVVPEAITLVIQASRGEISFKKPTVGCVASLCGLFCRAAIAAAPLALGTAPVASHATTPSEETADATPAVQNPEPVTDTKESIVSPPEEASAPPTEEHQLRDSEPVEQ